MTLEKSTDSYLLLDQEVKADYEETLFRDAVCSLRNKKNSTSAEMVKSLGSCTKMGRLSEKHVELEQKEDLVAKVHLALWPKNDMETFYRLLEEHPEVVNSRFGKCQDTLLHKASMYGKIEAVRKLVSMKPKIDGTNINGQTPLHLACLTSQEEIVEILLQEGKADYESRNIEGDCPAHLAVKGGNLKCLSLILEQFSAGCDPKKCKGALGNSMLHHACLSGRVEMTKYLLKVGFDPQEKNDLSETPLHLAAGTYSENSLEICQILIQSGIELNARTDWGDTPAHYAALGGTMDTLKYLIELGSSVSKDNAQDCEATKLCQKLGLSKEYEESMRYTILQKVGRSSCINKSIYLLDKMMEARSKNSANDCKPKMGRIGRERAFKILELNQQETEFFMISQEFHRNMNAPDSALKLFLKYTPDALEHLFDKCISSHCETEQVQGKIFFDFFLFCPPFEQGLFRKQRCDTGELTLTQILISHGKAYFLLHPLFETFIKLKGYRTWKLFLFYIFIVALYVSSVVGFGLTHYGSFKHSSPAEAKDFWWYFLLANAININLYTFKMNFISIEMMLRYIKNGLIDKDQFSKWWDIWQTLNLIFNVSRMLITNVFPYLLLLTDMEYESKKYFCAVNVITSSFDLMLTISQIPGAGVFLHMMKRVSVSMLRFFASYFWHFLGYAIAFHIIMPDEGAFKNVSDSIIKVLTMLMGEFDFTDNFVDTHWLSKVIFVLFVVDMSVVLMNLIIGLAVSDVEAIKRESIVQGLIYETYTTIFLEQQYLTLTRIPLIGSKFNSVRLVNQNTCKLSNFFYLDLVDLSENKLNKLVLDGGSCGCGIIETHPSPKTITESVVKILRKRIQGKTSRLDPVSEQVINELKNQNEDLQSRMTEMDTKMKQILDLVQDIHTKNNC